MRSTKKRTPYGGLFSHNLLILKRVTAYKARKIKKRQEISYGNISLVSRKFYFFIWAAAPRWGLISTTACSSMR